MYHGFMRNHDHSGHACTGLSPTAVCREHHTSVFRISMERCQGLRSRHTGAMMIAGCMRGNASGIEQASMHVTPSGYSSQAVHGAVCQSKCWEQNAALSKGSRRPNPTSHMHPIHHESS